VDGTPGWPAGVAERFEQLEARVGELIAIMRAACAAAGVDVIVPGGPAPPELAAAMETARRSGTQQCVRLEVGGQEWAAVVSGEGGADPAAAWAAMQALAEKDPTTGTSGSAASPPSPP
jgi:hypothetical protein